MAALTEILDISAKITGIRYTPFLCRKLNTYSLNDIGRAISNDSTFVVDIDGKNWLALSWWVSAKRTRSYPYTRVYDSLSFQGKKITIIPIFKDEGSEGDRDFLQWDTISLMSLLGVYTIIAYYSNAEKSMRYAHKITNQRFDLGLIREQIHKLLSYQSDALHWNLSQVELVGELGEKALVAYSAISRSLGIPMHSEDSARKRISELLKGRENFMNLSRALAKKAQSRESMTIQPKENLSGTKTTLTIKNYLGGNYYFTCDEVEVAGEKIYLVEGKHTRDGVIPSLDDVKDGLLKMILFTNLEEVKVGDKEYSAVPVLKLTSDVKFSVEQLSKTQSNTLRLLKRESDENHFKVTINGIDLKDIKI